MAPFLMALVNLGIGLWMARHADTYRQMNKKVKAAYLQALVSLDAGDEKTKLLRWGRQLMRRNRIMRIVHIALAALNFFAVGVNLGAFLRW